MLTPKILCALICISFIAPRNQTDIVPSFGGLVSSNITFSNMVSLLDVDYIVNDDRFSLEGIEVIMFTLDISGALRVRLGEPSTTVLNILDDDGKYFIILRVACSSV